MVFRSFALPIGIGLCASFLGLAFYVIDLGMFFPHTLLTIGMGVISQSGFSSLFEHLIFLSMNLFYIIVIMLLAILWLKKRDVKS